MSLIFVLITYLLVFFKAQFCLFINIRNISIHIVHTDFSMLFTIPKQINTCILKYKDRSIERKKGICIHM